MKHLIPLLFLPFVASAANTTLGTASGIARQCYAVGDTVTISDGTAAAVLGDGIATLDGSTITMKHPGFTLLKDSGGTEYAFGVYETPGGEGDVFFFDWAANNVGWASATWTKLTQNSDRTYPNHADDVAMILVLERGHYGYITVPSTGITVGQLVVGMTKHWTLDHTSGTVTPLVFSRTDAAPVLYLSRPDASTNSELQFRLGEYDRDNSGNVLQVTFQGSEMVVDFCGESPASSAYARKGWLNFAIARSRFDLAAGQTLRFTNGSRTTGNGNDFVQIRGRAGSGLHGSGTVVMDGVNFSCQMAAPDTFVTIAKLQSVTGAGPFAEENNTTRFNTRFDTVPSIPIEILSAHCPTNVNAQTTFRNFWTTGISNAWLSPSVLLSGCNYELQQNGAYSTTTNFYYATNAAPKVTIRGHVGIYGPGSYSGDGGHKDSDGNQLGRVTHEIRIRDLERFDRWSTMRVNGLNFNRGDTRTNDVKGVMIIDNWRDYVVRPAGVDPADYDGNVYAIIPWMTVHCNDNSQAITDNDWGTEQTFPGVREEDGCIRLVKSQNNLGSQSLSERGENDNFYFYSKSGFGLGGADRTLFSLVYCTQELPHYATGGNFYLDTASGGHKLTITSGAMAITRQNKWLGQPADMTRNGRIVLQGNPSYLHVPSRGVFVPSSGDSGGGQDYNMCWVPLVASNSLAKGGAGSIGLAGDQRGIQGTLVVNGGVLWLGYPAYKQHGYLYTYGNPTRGWPMHGCATDCDFRIRGGAVLSLASAGYTGKDSDGNDVDALVLATGADHRHTITLERSGNAVGGVYIAEGVEGVVYEVEYEDEAGEVVTFARGTWGSSQSAAANVDDRHFSGPGILRVQHDRLARPTVILVK